MVQVFAWTERPLSETVMNWLLIFVRTNQILKSVKYEVNYI